MNKIFTNNVFLTACSILILIGLMSNSSGRGNVFGQAVTGAPGDSNMTCASSGCHSSGTFSPSADLTVLDLNGNPVSSFIPGETYDITLATQTSGSPSAFGFQMVALDADNSSASNWSDIGNNMQIVTLGDRDYIEHNSPSSSNEFNTKWTAPSAGSGDVTFYFSANAVNGNGNPGGDGATSSTFVLSEIVTSSNDLTEASISIFPQPALDFVTISGEELNYEYTLFDIKGQKIKASNFTKTTSLDISQLTQGLYFVQLYNGDKTITKKLFKN